MVKLDTKSTKREIIKRCFERGNKAQREGAFRMVGTKGMKPLEDEMMKEEPWEDRKKRAREKKALAKEAETDCKELRAENKALRES